MITETYRNAFREVYLILENTDKELINKIPNKFMEFIKNNMNVRYETNIQYNKPLEQQKLLKETEGILALIYRTYLATDEEKQFFKKQSICANKEKENEKKNAYKGKTLEELFKNKNEDEVTINTETNNKQLVKSEENFFEKILTKLKRLFKK